MHPVGVLDDAGAIERARAGSGEAFALIYEDLARPVAAYLRAKGVRDVEDLTSEVFLAVFRGIVTFEGDEAALRRWVFTIAHRRVVDVWRQTGRRAEPVPYEAEDDRRAAASAEEGALDHVGMEGTVALLCRLTEEQREVLLLRVVADLTVEEVATVVGRAPGAVKALQRRGLASLRRILEREGVSL